MGWKVILPTPTDQYFDKVRIWLPRWLSRAEIETLETFGGKVLTKSKKLRLFSWKCKVDLHQPSRQCLEYLEQIMDGKPVLINKVEFACDWAGIEHEALFDFQDVHIVRKYRRRHCRVTLSEGTRYDAYRKPRVLKVYKEQFQRKTGELDCVHLELVVERASAVRRFNIATLRHMIEFDHESFWRERFNDLIRFYDVDEERLGRLLRNRFRNTRDSQPWIERRSIFRLNRDAHLGMLVMADLLRVQELLSVFGSRTISSALVKVTVRFDSWK